MRRVLDIGLPRHRKREHDGMQSKDVEQSEHAILIEEHKADEDHAAGQNVRGVEGERPHQKLREMKSSSVASRPSMSAAPRKSGTRKTRILAIDVSNSARRNPPTTSLPA